MTQDEIELLKESRIGNPESKEDWEKMEDVADELGVIVYDSDKFPEELYGDDDDEEESEKKDS